MLDIPLELFLEVFETRKLSAEILIPEFFFGNIWKSYILENWVFVVKWPLCYIILPKFQYFLSENWKQYKIIELIIKAMVKVRRPGKEL